MFWPCETVQCGLPGAAGKICVRLIRVPVGWPARSSARQILDATDNTSPRSRRSDGLRPPCSGLVRPEHRPAAIWRQSHQACIASLPLQSSFMSKTYLKSDHFSGGGSRLAPVSSGDRYVSTATAAWAWSEFPSLPQEESNLLPRTSGPRLALQGEQRLERACSK